MNIENKSISESSSDIPILYLWFGKTVPEDYLISISEMNYPVIFLKNPQIKRQWKRPLLDVQKADYYRLYHLYEHGGIYSDFDNTIDYPCLMKLLKPFKDQDKLVFMTDGVHTRAKTKQITNNLIYAPYPKMPILKKMLDAIDQTKLGVWDFAGIKFVGSFKEPQEVPMKQCVRHSYDWSWFEASNEVLGTNAKPHPKFAKKKQKKSQIIQQKQELKKEIQYLREDNFVKNDELKNLQNKIRQLEEKIFNQNIPQDSSLLKGVAMNDGLPDSLSFQPKEDYFSPRHFNSFTLICVLVILMLIRLILKKKKEEKMLIKNFMIENSQSMIQEQL